MDHEEHSTPSVPDVTWEQAMEYVERTIDETCARQGVSVEIRDPQLLALTIRYLKIGQRNHNALRLEVPATPPRR